jgi:hypothetical protein
MKYRPRDDTVVDLPRQGPALAARGIAEVAERAGIAPGRCRAWATRPCMCWDVHSHVSG